MIKIISLKDTTDIYTRDKFICLDRDWFEKGDIIYYNGATPIHILYKSNRITAEFGWWYKIEEWMTFKAGDWFTLEKQEEPIIKSTGLVGPSGSTVFNINICAQIIYNPPK